MNNLTKTQIAENKARQIELVDNEILELMSAMKQSEVDFCIATVVENRPSVEAFKLAFPHSQAKDRSIASGALQVKKRANVRALAALIRRRSMLEANISAQEVEQNANRIFKDCMAKEKYSEALKANDQIGRLHGYFSETINVNPINPTVSIHLDGVNVVKDVTPSPTPDDLIG